MATLKYLGAPFFTSPCVSRLTLNSPRNVTDRRRCGNSADDRLTKNRTYHNGMPGARAIVETLRQFFDVQSNPVPLSRFCLCALWRNCVPRETLIVIVYVSGRVTSDNRFHDYALPRCEPTDACATSWLDALWWALLNRIMGQSFCINEIIKSGIEISKFPRIYIKLDYSYPCVKTDLQWHFCLDY